MEIWNRKTLIQEAEVGGGAIRFAYGTAFGRMLAKTLLCRPFVSKLYGAWQSSPLSRGKVKRFMRQYQISTADCTQQEFSDFNEFFTRQRKNYVNQTEGNELPAIADSKLLVLPISTEQVFTVKDVPYTLEELLEDGELAEYFQGGLCLIFRLSPQDYHRYVYPDEGRCGKTVEIPGVLHTVNPLGGRLGVYRRNTRHYTLLETTHFGKVLQMEVGALLVGKIQNHHPMGERFEKLQEKGYFAYGGSTVILLLERGRLEIDEDIRRYSALGIETKVTIGQRIGVLL